MIDSYIILNRKTNTIIKIFILNIIIIAVLFIWGINRFEYQSFFHIHSKIINFNSYFVLELLIPVKEVNQIKEQNKLFIGNKEYHYNIKQIENNIIYQNNTNYQTIYIQIKNLDEKYLINNYHIDIKIPTYSKKLIEYLKNKKEEIWII